MAYDHTQRGTLHLFAAALGFAQVIAAAVVGLVLAAMRTVRPMRTLWYHGVGSHS